MKKKSSRKRNIEAQIPTPAQPEEAPGDAEFEEQLLLFWKNHGNRVTMLIALVVVAVLAYQFSGYLAQRKLEKIQAAYQGTENTADLVAFGKEHSDHSLGGFAFLQAAHQEYEQKQFQEAAGHYQIAAENLADTPYAGRAKLGYAMANLQNGQEETARQTFAAIAADEALLDSTQAEAAYNLAVFHWDRENFDEVEKQLDFIDTLAKPGYWIWAIKANQLRESIPELRTEDESKAETAGL